MALRLCVFAYSVPIDSSSDHLSPSLCDSRTELNAHHWLNGLRSTPGWDSNNDAKNRFTRGPAERNKGFSTERKERPKANNNAELVRVRSCGGFEMGRILSKIVSVLLCTRVLLQDRGCCTTKAALTWIGRLRTSDDDNTRDWIFHLELFCRP